LNGDFFINLYLFKFTKDLIQNNNLFETQEKEERKVVWSRYQRPKSNWAIRNPRSFQIGFILTGLSIFFSRTIYDCFILPSYKIDSSNLTEEDKKEEN
jgi:hypothetical protein